MIDRKKHKLKEFNSKQDNNKDTFVNVNLSGERNLLPPGEINHIVNSGDEFNDERKESTLYRLIFTVNPIFSNPLFNVNTTGYQGEFFKQTISSIKNNSWKTFKEKVFRKNVLSQDIDDISYNYEESINRNLLERNGWFGFNDPDVTKAEPCKFYDMEPTRKRFDLNSNVAKNWDILITYPATSDDTHHIVKNGLLIVDAKYVTVGARKMLALASSTFHGLTNGDRVKVEVPSLGLNSTYRVERLGLDDGSLKYNYFVIDVKIISLPSSVTGRMRRNFNGELSIYYFRKVKSLMINKDDYDIYPLAFSESVYNDQIYQIAITEDLDVRDLKDNLGRPLSELFITFMKTDSDQGNDNKFTNVSSGVDLEFLQGNVSDINNSNIRVMYGGAAPSLPDTHTPLSDSPIVLGNNREYYLDVVEFNRLEQREVVLADVMHRFNTYNREIASTSTGDSPKGPRKEGYTYKPHHRVKIREYSLYVEQGDESTAGIPDYAADLGDGRYLWRDLLDIGVFDGEDDLLDYPFTNGAHYIHTNICLINGRQDPFGVYGLYYAGSGSGDNFDPADPRGDAITDKWITNIGDDIC